MKTRFLPKVKESKIIKSNIPRTINTNEYVVIKHEPIKINIYIIVD